MVALESRLRKRASENEEELQRRLQNAKDEMAYGRAPGNFDVKIVNDDLEYAFLKLVTTLRMWYPLLPPIPEPTLEQKKEALTRFFQKHNAEKVKDVDSILTKYKFSDTVTSLYIRYGEYPPGWGSRRMAFKTEEAVLGKNDRTAIVEPGQTAKAEVAVKAGENVRWFFGLNQYDGADAGFGFQIDWVGTEYSNWGETKNVLNYPQMRAPKYPQGLYGDQTADGDGKFVFTWNNSTWLEVMAVSYAFEGGTFIEPKDADATTSKPAAPPNSPPI